MTNLQEKATGSITKFAGVISLVACISSIASAVASWRSSYASWSSEEISKQTLKVAQRAYLEVLPHTGISINTQMPTKVSLEVVNRGATPGIIKSIKPFIGIARNGEKDDFKPEYGPNIDGNDRDLFKDSPMMYSFYIFNNEEIENIIKNDSGLYIGVDVSYEDEMGDKYIKHYCDFYSNKKNSFSKERSCIYFNNTEQKE